jgi:glycosyltransferase involved in cell wall biosynthesis
LKKILFIAAHRKNRAPNQRFRFEQYLEYLEKHGITCELSYLISASDDKIMYSPGNLLGKILIGLKAGFRRFKDVLNKNEYDYIFIVREAFMTGSTFFEKQFGKSRAKIIYDFDDSIWIDVVSENNKLLGWLKNADKTSQIIGMADLVMAGNKFLADYAERFNANVVIVPTTIDTDLYVPKYNADKKVLSIGWSGSLSTIEHFKYALPALEQLKKKYGNKIDFRVIGDANYKNPDLNIVGQAWNFSNEVADLNQFDIGIMPLPDTEWAWGKCGLKALQYMALEIPTVISPVGVNREIISDGVNGFLAASIDEWVGKLSLLIDDSELRIKVGQSGRKTVDDKYSVKSQQARYLELINSL